MRSKKLFRFIILINIDICVGYAKQHLGVSGYRISLCIIQRLSGLVGICIPLDFDHWNNRHCNSLLACYILGSVGHGYQVSWWIVNLKTQSHDHFSVGTKVYQCFTNQIKTIIHLFVHDLSVMFSWIAY